MINQPTQQKPITVSWVLDPGRLIDRFLDYIERLGSLALPARTDNPSYADAKIKPRLERLGA